MAPAKAADIAAQNGVVIHTIAVGDPDAAADADRSTSPTLQAIAAATGGSFNRAEDATGLAAIYAEIDAAGARAGRDHLLAPAHAARRPARPPPSSPSSLARLRRPPSPRARLRRRSARPPA